MKKKAIALLVNDIHLDKNNGALVKDIFDQLLFLARKNDIRHIIIGGDVFTNRSGQPLSCLTDWKDIVEKVWHQGIQLEVIPGNHDKTDANDERSYLDVYNHCKVYRNASLIQIDDVDFVLIPYFAEDKWLEEWEQIDKKLSKKRISILITHIGFDGVKNNDGSTVQSVIKPSMFKDYNKVLIGHYHNASQLTDNVFYTGSAYQNNYGENITDKGFTLIYNDGSIKFIPSKFPKYIKQVISANDRETLQNLLENYEGESYDHIRFEFVGKKVDCQKINISEIQGRYGIDCKFVCDEEKEAIEASEGDIVLCFDKQTVVKDFCKFCAENNIKGKNMRYGLELVKNI